MAWRFKRGVKLTFWIVIMLLALSFLTSAVYKIVVKDFKEIKQIECNEIENVSFQCLKYNETQCPFCAQCNKTICPEQKVCPSCNITKETVTETKVVYVEKDKTAEQVAEEELRKTADVFAEMIEKGNSSGIYSLLTEDRKTAISEKEFSIHYPDVVYGPYRVNLGEAGMSTLKNPFSTVIAENISITNNTAVVSFINFRKDGTYERLKSYKFLKEDSWKVDDFDVLIYASCSKTEDCDNKSGKLIPICENTCAEKSRFYVLRTEKPFSCSDDVCGCRCYHNQTETGYTLEPIII